jgi:tRNA (guanine37-N1)-methyltransferase
VDEEISIGDFVLTGGEIPAMAVTDAVCRLLPGVLSDEECFTDESHWNGLLEYPQYSRPAVWHDRPVPEVLRSGNHQNVARWRRKQSILRTMRRRPDLFAQLRLPDHSRAEKKFIRELEEEDDEFRVRYAQNLGR